MNFALIHFVSSFLLKLQVLLNGVMQSRHLIIDTIVGIIDMLTINVGTIPRNINSI